MTPVEEEEEEGGGLSQSQSHRDPLSAFGQPTLDLNIVN